MSLASYELADCLAAIKQKKGRFILAFSEENSNEPTKGFSLAPTPERATLLGMRDLFRRFSHRVSEIVGSPWAFVLATLIIVAWVLSGPSFHYSDTWQLVINTGTTIVTFLMVFLIQNTQNRDSRALHLKLDELLRSVGRARTGMVEVENMTDDELNTLEEEFTRLAREISERRAKREGKKV